MRAGYVTEAELTLALSGQLGVAAATAKDLEVDPEIIKLLPDEFVKRFEVVPVRREGQVLTIACATPNNLRLQDEVRFITGMRDIRAILATEMAIRRVIEKHYSTHALLEEVIQNGGLYEKALKAAPPDERKPKESDEEEGARSTGSRSRARASPSWRS